MAFTYDDTPPNVRYVRVYDAGWTGSTSGTVDTQWVVLIRPTGPPWTSYNDPPPELPPIEEPPPVRVMPPHYTLAPPPFERPAIMPAHTRCAAPRRATERRHRSSVRRFARVCA